MFSWRDSNMAIARSWPRGILHITEERPPLAMLAAGRLADFLAGFAPPGVVEGAAWASPANPAKIAAWPVEIAATIVAGLTYDNFLRFRRLRRFSLQ
jgi:hypothetical protein